MTSRKNPDEARLASLDDLAHPDPAGDQCPACGCMRYPSSPCPVRTETLLCPECITARCVLVHYPDHPESKEHVSVDNLDLPEDPCPAVRL